MAAADAEALFAEHHQTLLRYLCRAIGQPDAARDLAQDVFLRISRSAPPHGDAIEVRAWMFRIARNLVIDYHRNRARAVQPVPLSDLVARNASQDVTLAVNQALGTLPDLDRDVFLMREISGLSYDEIATVCDLTPEAVRARLYRTRLALRERLEAPIATHRGRTMRLSGR